MKTLSNHVRRHRRRLRDDQLRAGTQSRNFASTEVRRRPNRRSKCEERGSLHSPMPDKPKEGESE